ncbi:MAG: RDD family protein [Cocleimonas sp.]
MAIDTLYHVNTPEGISLRLSPAGPVPRMLAWLIDILIRLAMYIVIYVSLAYFGNTGKGIAGILTFLLEWFYPVYFELYKNGQTPGKKSFDLYVAMENASPITPGASIIRNLLRFVDFLPLFYGFGFISMLLTNRFQRLGDLVAGTVVLHKDLVYPPVDEIDIAAIAPPIPLQLQEQQALVRFYQRTPYLTNERANELSLLTGKLVEDQKQPTQNLLGIANWLMGNRGESK